MNPTFTTFTYPCTAHLYTLNIMQSNQQVDRSFEWAPQKGKYTNNPNPT